MQKCKLVQDHSVLRAGSHPQPLQDKHRERERERERERAFGSKEVTLSDPAKFGVIFPVPVCSHLDCSQCWKAGGRWKLKIRFFPPET
jgi:hypothetical protein